MSRSLIRRRKVFSWENWKIVTLPNILTFIRISVLPFLVAVLISSFRWKNWAAVGLFAFAGATDFMDGFIARRYKQVSKFGSFLDPIADKLIVSTTLLMAAGSGYLRGIHLVPAALILCREFVISGLREFLAASGQELRVARLAQYKTTIQILALVLILSQLTTWVVMVGLGLLWVAALLTCMTGWAYLKLSFGFMRRRQRLSERLRWRRQQRHTRKEKLASNEGQSENSGERV